MAVRTKEELKEQMLKGELRFPLDRENVIDLIDSIFDSAGARKSGFFDYNDTSTTTTPVTLLPDTWTDVPNDGAGPFSNTAYAPEGVTSVMDNSTGYLEFSQLSLGDQVIIRNDFKVTPSTNNALLEVRYVLGQGAGEYELLFWSERLDSGSGSPYQRVISFPIYMGDENTRGGEGKLQVKLSSNGTLVNAGSYINIQVR